MEQVWNIAALFLEGKDPAKDVILAHDRSYTYGELRCAAAIVADYLRHSLCSKGDRVLLVAENSFFWAGCYLGILGAGLVCVPIPPTLSTEDVLFILENTEARHVFIQSRLYRKYEAVIRDRLILLDNDLITRSDVSSLESLTRSCGLTDLTQEPSNRDDLACLMFTSGSTGRPRGVMVSHGNIKANTDSIVSYLELTSRDRIMTVLPFHYCFGTSLLHTHLRVGGSLVLDNQFLYPEKVLQRMRETECTGFAGVPSHYQVLLRRTSIRKQSFPRLRYIQQAGGHLPASFVLELQNVLRDTKIFIMYGQTEATARLSYLPPEYVSSKPGSIGKGMPGVKLSVVNNEGQLVHPGEVGEIVAEGANIAQGYWRCPDESSKTFREGKLYTRDSATIDEEGFITIVGRTRDVLKCGGVRSSCQQLEEDLSEFGDIVEIAVAGIPDELLGEAVRAFVVPRRNNFDLENFRRFCKSRVPLQLVPKEVVILKSLPKNEAGKIVRRDLVRFVERRCSSNT